ncbi:von Hippel-Lindau disease tumor suppressor-like [Ostrea edulis]|uniref:von Hippel-Lindau disease tumor suppressor-like n=1 Tax=Ostrea edulis TaxID=37623 RepID=UPI0020946E78|nr:von Hippel-Lindau disease tumor suppressor-like [Ostrea edulis]XP_048777015.1 von Hippel-Lindau disease tumor suppressor-like [Ostrea edulis]XP_048777016.1 von Hippel-Lindau disease tumor suppressor-like [Ostrea edulis]XP_056009681.1 von Hippel-Lindau disease tumor suppressor-like [Ostrea edulis]
MAEASEPIQRGVEVRKSKKSVICSFVRFMNRTQRGVDIVWLNYEGARVKFKTLSAYEFVDVNTYVGHPWIFLDMETGERLVVNLKSVYEPTTGWVPGHWPPVRKVVNITIPIYSLKDSCIRFFRRHLPKKNINKLDMPSSLLQEMYERYDTPAITSGLRSSARVMAPSNPEERDP